MRNSVRFGCAALLLAAGLAACGESAPAPAPGQAQEKANKVTIRNRAHERLMALPDPRRRVGLVRAIRQTGNRCPLRVEPNPVYQGEYEGMAMWTARCDNNEQYAVFIAPNDDVQVRNCRDMAQLRLPACRPLPPAAPNVPRRPAPKAG